LSTGRFVSLWEGKVIPKRTDTLAFNSSASHKSDRCEETNTGHRLVKYNSTVPRHHWRSQGLDNETMDKCNLSETRLNEHWPKVTFVNSESSFICGV